MGLILEGFVVILNLSNPTFAGCPDSLRTKFEASLGAIKKDGYRFFMAPMTIRQLETLGSLVKGPLDANLLGKSTAGRPLDRFLDHNTVGLVFSIDALRTAGRWRLQMDTRALTHIYEPDYHESHGLLRILALAQDPKLRLDVIVSELQMENLRAIVVPRSINEESQAYSVIDEFAMSPFRVDHLIEQPIPILHWSKVQDLGILASPDFP